MATWKSGIFGCFSDIPTCLMGWCCPCYLYGQNAESIDGSGKIGACIGFFCLSGCCLSCILHKPKRQKLREAYKLEEKPSDLIATCLCSGCAVCQEAIELKQRGVQAGQRIPTTGQPR